MNPFLLAVFRHELLKMSGHFTEFGFTYDEQGEQEQFRTVQATGGGT